MSIKLLTTAIALTLATTMAPAFGQVTQEEKSKVTKDKEKASSAPAKKGEPAKAGALSNEEKSKLVTKDEPKMAAPKKASGEKATAGAVTQEEKSKQTK